MGTADSPRSSVRSSPLLGTLPRYSPELSQYVSLPSRRSLERSGRGRRSRVRPPDPEGGSRGRRIPQTPWDLDGASRAHCGGHAQTSGRIVSPALKTNRFGWFLVAFGKPLIGILELIAVSRHNPIHGNLTFWRTVKMPSLAEAALAGSLSSFASVSRTPIG